MLLDELSDAFWSVCSEVVHHHDLTRTQARHEHLLDVVGLKYPSGSGPFYGASDGPIPSVVMLESTVVFLPRVRGTGRYRRVPLGA